MQHGALLGLSFTISTYLRNQNFKKSQMMVEDIETVAGSTYNENKLQKITQAVSEIGSIFITIHVTHCCFVFVVWTQRTQCNIKKYEKSLSLSLVLQKGKPNILLLSFEMRCPAIHLRSFCSLNEQFSC